MVEISALFHGFAVVLSPFNLLLMLIGIVLGVIIGVLPGLGGANGVAILLPLTFSMAPTSASSGAKSVISTTAKSAPTNDEVKAAVSAWPPCPFCASG